MVVAAPTVSCPSSSWFVLLDVFSMITYGLSDFTQEPHTGSLENVRLDSALVAKPFAREHSSAFQS